MAHARPADRASSQTATYLATAALAAVVFAGIVLFSTLANLGIGGPAAGPTPVDQALMQSARQWELERRQQAGYVDPLTQSGDRWELERRQQGSAPN